ncbi:hypothetical protein B0T26DRAFT_603827, partial [Lasiosphaeria miniovina]
DTESAALGDSIEALITRWQACTAGLQHLQHAATEASRPIGGLNNLLRVQQRALDKLVQKQRGGSSSPSSTPIAPAQYAGMKSCCWDDRWAVVSKLRGLVHINKDFPRSPRMAVSAEAGWLAFKDQPFQEKPVSIDAVVDSGATWIKFVSISSRTLEYQVVAEGWESESSDSDIDEGGNDKDGKSSASKGHGDGGLANTEFADSIEKLVLAARWNHIPRIHLILSALREGQSDVIDRMIAYVRGQMGGGDVSVTVSCANSPFVVAPPPPLDAAIAALVGGRGPLIGDDCSLVTPTVNLDPSVLVALVTDLHHGPVDLQPEAQRQIIVKSILDHETDSSHELVPRQDILASVLYPVLRGRKLVCTRFAAQYLRQLIGAISTHSEEQRASLILPPPSSSPDSPTPVDEEELRREFQKWSNLPVPEDLHLPVEIVDDLNMTDVEPLIAAGKLPPMAAGLARDLSRLNRSVYLCGWANCLTTVTGHRGIERQVRLSLARHWTPSSVEKNERPPDIWHRHLGGYLIHRDKPKDWRAMLPPSADGSAEGQVPAEVVRWTSPWTTWGRGISTYGLPDTKTWDGVGHDDKQGYGRRVNAKEDRGG